MANIPVSSGYWTPAQIALMQPGQRWDIAGDWKLWVFGTADGNAWFQQGIETGTRVVEDARYPVMLAGLQAMITLGILKGFVLFEVPVGWDPKLGDNLFVFPDKLT